MKVIIPIAGFGTRLRPHTLTKPKVLINVAGKPIIYHIVEQIINEKFADSIIFITGQFSEVFENYIKKEFNFNFHFVKQEKANGLGHAIDCAKHLFNTNKKEEVLIILGDTMFDVNLKDIVNKKESIICVKEVEDPKSFGVTETNEMGFITRLVEKPTSPEISKSKNAIVGIYCIKNSQKLFEALNYIISENIKTKNEFQLTDALARMLAEGESFQNYKIENWLDCGKKEAILETNEFLLKKKKNKYKIETCFISDIAYIGKDVTLNNSVIGNNVTINDNCHIKNSIIENSIIDSNCVIENAVIKDSLIGEHSVIKLCYKKLDLSEYSHIYD